MSAGARRLSPEQVARIIAVVKANPELTLNQLAQRFGLSPCSLRGRLREAGLYVRRDGHGNEVKL